MKTIIVFEDEQAISSVFRASFERMGYTVLQAAARNQATGTVDQSPPPIGLVIADILVRVFTRIRVARAITGIHPQMAVLFISGLGPVDSETLTFPRIEFLQKPFLPWLLEEHIRGAVPCDAMLYMN
ncbi:MAG TPA: hypothetical protein VKR61_20175 [Bryobacteraceae bacterium]|nr:hypothetical protein [Bryobacteraceae bacterium]